MARDDIRPVIKLCSAAGTGCACATRKNRGNDPDRPQVGLCRPPVRRQVVFREEP